MMNNKSDNIIILIALMTFIFFSSCSPGMTGNGGGESLPGSGSYRLLILWPDRLPADGVRFIPPGTASVKVEITGTGLALAVTGVVSYPDDEIVFNNLPSGEKVATIEALDGDSVKTVRRKDSFIVYNNTTTDSGNIPLGVAITGNPENPTFEPSAINAPYGWKLYVQNWVSESFTCRISKDGAIPEDFFLPSPTRDASGRWIFSDCSVKPVETCLLYTSPSPRDS